MEVSELLAEENIALDVPVKSKRSALLKVAARLAKRTGMDERTVHAGLLARESAGSTAVGSGVAIPHAVLEHLSRPTASLTRLAKPIDFAAPDNGPVDLLFTILWPLSAIRHFLPALASASRLFRSDPLREMLRQARSPAEALEIIRFKQDEPGWAARVQTRAMSATTGRAAPASADRNSTTPV